MLFGWCAGLGGQIVMKLDGMVQHFDTTLV